MAQLAPNIFTITLPAVTIPPVAAGLADSQSEIANITGQIASAAQAVYKSLVAPLEKAALAITGTLAKGAVALVLTGGSPVGLGVRALHHVFKSFSESASQQSTTWGRMTAAVEKLFDSVTESLLSSRAVQAVLQVFAENLETLAGEMIKIGGVADAAILDAAPGITQVGESLHFLVRGSKIAKAAAEQWVALELLRMAEWVTANARFLRNNAVPIPGIGAISLALETYQARMLGVLAGARGFVVRAAAGLQKEAEGGTSTLELFAALAAKQAEARKRFQARRAQEAAASAHAPESEGRTHWEALSETIENWAGSPAAFRIADYMRASLQRGSDSLAGTLEGVKGTIRMFREEYAPSLEDSTRKMLGGVESMADAHAQLAGQVEAVTRAGSAAARAFQAVKMTILALTTATLAAQQYALGVAALATFNVPLAAIRFAAAAAYTAAAALAGASIALPPPPAQSSPRSRARPGRAPLPGVLNVNVEGSAYAPTFKNELIEALRTQREPARFHHPHIRPASRGEAALTVVEFAAKEAGKQAATKFAGEFLGEIQGSSGHSLAHGVRQEISTIPPYIREAVRGVLTAVGGPFGTILGGVLGSFLDEAASFFGGIF